MTAQRLSRAITWPALAALLLALWCVEAVPVTVPPASELPPADEMYAGPQDPNPEAGAPVSLKPAAVA